MITSFNGGDAARCGLDRRSIRRAEDGPALAGPQHSGGRPKPGFLPREEGEGTEPGKKVGDAVAGPADPARPAEREVRSGRQSKCRSEEHTSELQSLMRTPYAVFCLKYTYKNHILNP